MLALSIIKPCHERWENMIPGANGIYCESCCKNVIDFSRMPDGEILDYFQKRKNVPVCGRFRKDQLNRPIIEISASVFMMKIPFWKKFLAALFIYFSSFITGCSTEQEKDYTKVELPPIPNSFIAAKQLPSKPLMTDSVALIPYHNMVLGFVEPKHTNTNVQLFQGLGE